MGFKRRWRGDSVNRNLLGTGPADKLAEVSKWRWAQSGITQSRAVPLLRILDVEYSRFHCVTMCGNQRSTFPGPIANATIKR